MSGFQNQNAIDELMAAQPLSFSQALQLLLLGKQLKRRKWKDFLYVMLQKPDEHSKMKEAYFYTVCQDKQPKPITLQTSDLLANDWIIA